MKTKHSKTPWILREPGIDDCGDHHSFNYIEVSRCRYITCEGTSEEEANENAKHIVKCVNHFDEMKEILMHLIEANEHTQKVFQSMANRGNYPRELFPDEFVNDNKNLFLGNQGWWYMLEPTEKAKQLLEKLEQYES